MKGKNTMSRMKLNGVALGMILVAGSLLGATSARTTVWVKPDESLQWKTVMANPSAISLDWPSGATYATFSVDPGDGKTVSYNITDTTLSTYELYFDMPLSQGDERVLAMTLTYKDADGQSVGTSHMARVGLVGGVNGVGTRCMPSEASMKWQKAEGKFFVAPVPEDAVRMTVRSQPVEPLDANGWLCVRRTSGESSVAMELETAKGIQTALVKFARSYAVFYR